MNINLLNKVTRSSSLPHEAIIKLPPDENGLIALLCEPRTVAANNASALNPVDAARAGINGNKAGVTTPVVELKKLINAPTKLNAIGTNATETFEPIHEDNSLIVPALTATAINIPAPAIIIIVFQGTNSIMTKGVLRGGGDTAMLMLTDNIFLWVLAIPLGIAAGFYFKWPPFWVYICLKSDQIVKTVWAFLRLRSRKWIKKISTGKK